MNITRTSVAVGILLLLPACLTVMAEDEDPTSALNKELRASIGSFKCAFAERQATVMAERPVDPGVVKERLRDALNSGGPTVKSRMSSFGGNFDRGDNGKTATGVRSWKVPGVAVNVDGNFKSKGNRSRLNGYWLVKMPDGDWIYKQIDLGPGRKPYRNGVHIDLSAAALPAHGHSPREVNSLTYNHVVATYLGKDRSWAPLNGKCVANCRRKAQ